MSTQDDKQEENTLAGFIKKYEKLITGIGVFGALTAFLPTLKTGRAREVNQQGIGVS